MTSLIDQVLRKFAVESEKALSHEKIDFSESSPINQAAKDILIKLDRYRIGPRLLLLLGVFAFPKEKREKIWNELQKVISQNR